VEDNENESELLAGYLRTCDFHVVTARDGADALEYLAGNDKPHVMLLDMNMPRMDGRTTIGKIRSNPKCAGLKVFAVSGASPEESSVRVGPNGVDRWFTKPIRPDRLVGEINRELAHCGAPA
jgi:DNA-binding response OmpR family regulator